MAKIIRSVCSCVAYLYGNSMEKYFQVGGGIILFLGALGESKLDGLKSRNFDFDNFQILGTLGSCICGFEYTKLLERMFEKMQTRI